MSQRGVAAAASAATWRQQASASLLRTRAATTIPPAQTAHAHLPLLVRVWLVPCERRAVLVRVRIWKRRQKGRDVRCVRLLLIRKRWRQRPLAVHWERRQRVRERHVGALHATQHSTGWRTSACVDAAASPHECWSACCRARRARSPRPQRPRHPPAAACGCAGPLLRRRPPPVPAAGRPGWPGCAPPAQRSCGCWPPACRGSAAAGRPESPPPSPGRRRIPRTRRSGRPPRAPRRAKSPPCARVAGGGQQQQQQVVAAGCRVACRRVGSVAMCC